jgi:DNA-binding NarL/FixJ family response regulator
VQPCVVILSAQPLFAEGVANRLRQYLQHTELEIVDPREPDAMTQIVTIQPAIMLLDVTDSEATRFCSLSKIWLSLPALKIIRLDPQHGQIQVVTSEQRPAVEVRDLIEVIETSS